jgi:hypothetical protein
MPLSVVVPGAKIWSIELSLFPSRSPKVTRIHKWTRSSNQLAEQCDFRKPTR